MKLAVITDTSASISEVYKNYDNLHILDIPLTIDGTTYSSKEISEEAFYDLMATCEDVPKSAQPAIGDLVAKIDALKAQGYTHILGLFLSKEISGFYQNIFALQEDGETIVYFPETSITSAPLGYMVETALRLAQAGKSWDEIKAAFETQKEEDRAYMLIDDLKWLSKSGRLSNGAAILGTLLNIKPVLTFSQDGKVAVFDKVRTEKKMMARMKELLKEGAKPELHQLYIIDARGEERAQELYDYAHAQGFTDAIRVPFGAVIATHLGLGAVAYAWTPKIKE
ncbi:MAG: DegV family protein [Streptococcaceae bacterium]|jgi:DegV family protein with EDD domain|nr:DegV family protein [Streptococcaceae bacterium]